MAVNDAKVEEITQEIEEYVEDSIAPENCNQEEAVDVLDYISSWCRDRAALIRKEAGLD